MRKGSAIAIVVWPWAPRLKPISIVFRAIAIPKPPSAQDVAALQTAEPKLSSVALRLHLEFLLKPLTIFISK